MAPNPYDAYGKNQKVTAQEAPVESSSRDVDARALLACASRINTAMELMQKDPSKENLKLYSEAIRHNQRLWTIFQVALTDPQNALPENLKRTLLSLSRYVDTTSFRTSGKYTKELAESLININRLLAAGLSKTPPADAAPAPQMETRDVPTSLMTSA